MGEKGGVKEREERGGRERFFKVLQGCKKSHDRLFKNLCQCVVPSVRRVSTFFFNVLKSMTK